MTQERLQQTNLRTGEVLEDGFIAYIAPKRKNGFHKRGWVAMTQDEQILALAKSPRLQGQDFRVFFILVGHLELENYILTPQTEMANELGMPPSHFSRSVSRLIEEGVILKGPKIGRVCSYKLNPEYGWKGSAKKHVEALDEHRKARQARMKKAGITGVINRDAPTANTGNEAPKQ
jgi:hypothetical protein